MTNHLQAAIEAGKLALCKHYNEWEDGQIVWESQADIQEEINEFTDAAESALDAMLPHLREMIAQEIVDYWEACGELIDTHNGARLAFDAIAARIAKGPQQ